MPSLQKIDSQAAAARGYSHEYLVQFTDLNDTAGTAKTLTACDDLPAGTRVQLLGYQVDTLFDGGATSELTVAVGWDLASGTDDSDGLMAAASIHADATPIRYGPPAVADVDASTVDNTYGQQENDVITSLRSRVNTELKRPVKVFNDTADLNFVFTSTGANLTALTAGRVRFFLRLNAPLN